MREGKRMAPAEDLATIRERLFVELERLPEGVKRLCDPAPYPVRISQALQDLAAEVDRRAH
jgi:hypothetical protein